MERRYDDWIQTYVDETWNQGWSLIPWWKIYEAYGVERVGKNVWRDLLARWREVNSKKKSNFALIASKDNGETLLLICGDPKKNTKEARMLFSVDELADDIQNKLGMD